MDLVLGPSGSIVGRLVSQDGALGIAGAQVVLAYMAPSGALGRAFFTTGVDGSFAFDAIPVGAFALEAIVFARDGIARLDGVLVSNGQVLDLGDVPLDEQDPYVVVSEPAAGDADVPIDQVVRLTFNEALADAPIDPQAIYLRGPAGRVPAQLSLELDTTSGEPRVLTIRPDAPLASETEFQAVVVDGELLSAVGAVIAEGPVDRVGRSLATAFTSSFRTRDQDPPGLLSLTPDDGAIQVDPRAVVRLSFDEPIAAEGIAFTLTGPDGAVPGRVDIGVDSRVLVFTPTAPLRANASYTAQVDGIRDVAGNLAEGLPFSTSFQTLDTLGPGIATLALSGPAVGGATRNAVATLAQPETGVSIRVSADLVTIGQSAPGVLSVPVTLPLSGSLILRAVAIDRFGNEGPIAELPVSVLANQPPSVSFTRILPPSGAVLSGSTLSVRVSGSDDVSVASLKAAASGAATCAARDQCRHADHRERRRAGRHRTGPAHRRARRGDRRQQPVEWRAEPRDRGGGRRRADDLDRGAGGRQRGRTGRGARDRRHRDGRLRHHALRDRNRGRLHRDAEPGPRGNAGRCQRQLLARRARGARDRRVLHAPGARLRRRRSQRRNVDRALDTGSARAAPGRAAAARRRRGGARSGDRRALRRADRTRLGARAALPAARRGERSRSDVDRFRGRRTAS